MFALMSVVFAFTTPVASIILGGLGALTLIPIIGYQVEINKYKKQLDTEE